jgi:hypothetical protein
MDIALIAVFVILSLVLFLAMFQFLKTSKDKRYIFFTEDKNASDPSYAPEYTKQERINLALKHGSWILPLFIIIQYYFFPWLKDYASHANCYIYGNGHINGIHLLFYGLFIFMPLSFAVIVFITEGKRSIKVLKIGQNPLPGEKVFRPTKYKYGVTSKIKPLIVLVVIICFILTSVWGGFTAYNMTKIIKPCTANKALQLTMNLPR